MNRKTTKGNDNNDNNNDDIDDNNEKEKETKGQKSIVNDEHCCCICLFDSINTVLIPCGHACLCKGCVQQYDKTLGCPICRTKIENIYDLFVV